METTLELSLEKKETVRLGKENEQLHSLLEISDSDLQQEITQLLSLITQKDTQLEQKDTQLEQKDTQLEQKDSVIEKLKNELLILRRKLFGRSSERYVKEDPNQLKLDFVGVETLPEE
ncbi:MAG: hypothetical protein LBI45_07545, partial [Bacteroidales bacterium]|nr:hypothetical protein [Bacteroidales bacterium]